MKTASKSLILFLSLCLIGLLIFEKYPQKIINKFTSATAQKIDYDYKDNWKYDQETDFHRVYKKKGKVVMLGNSITYYCNWSELLDRNDIINRGIGEDVTEGYYNRLDEIYNTEAEICFILGGFNDIYKGVPTEKTINNIEKIVQDLLANNIQPVLQSTLLVAKDFRNSENINKQIKTFNSEFEKIAEENKITYIDLNQLLGNKDYLQPKYSFDGVHITADAYVLWGKEIEQVIEQLQSE